jgi:hypothetical protein
LLSGHHPSRAAIWPRTKYPIMLGMNMVDIHTHKVIPTLYGWGRLLQLSLSHCFRCIQRDYTELAFVALQAPDASKTQKVPKSPKSIERHKSKHLMIFNMA